MSILIINGGSSSVRFSLYTQTDENIIVRMAEAHHQNVKAFDSVFLSNFIKPINRYDITLVVHRVVHGGELLTTPCLIDDAVEAEIKRLIPLAPLHNPFAIEWIQFIRRLFGEQIPQLAIFDTAFYHSLPQVAKTYALPQSLCQKYSIRRYGFHGIAHRAMLNRWQSIRPEIKKGGRVISVQLGSGCSITAIDHGAPVDTSMGFSPQEGLVMATRCGDLDSAISPYIQRQSGLSAEKIEQILNKQSGLLGLSGESSDMRVLLNSNSPEAKLAVELYCYRVRKYIGAYLTILGGADAILFGGGVGENSAEVRTKILEGMTWLGIDLNIAENEKTEGIAAMISTIESKISVWVLPVDEARVMVEEVLTTPYFEK